MQKGAGVNYCQRCRVYVDVQESACPLCHGPLIHREQDLPFYSQLSPFAQDQDRENFWQEVPRVPTWTVLRRLITLVVFALLCTVFALLALAFLQKERTAVWPIGYSYAILSLAYATLVIAFLGHVRKFLVTLLCLVIATILFLFALDLMDNTLTWSYRRGMPIVFAATLPLALPTIIWKLSRVKGLNVVAVFAFSLAASLCLMDLAIDRRGIFQFAGWSIIPAGILIALGLYCLYLHYYAKVDWHIDRIFHVRRSGSGYSSRDKASMP